MEVGREREKRTKEERASDCFPLGSENERDGKDWQLKNDASLPFSQDGDFVRIPGLLG